jgi:hypothetical protein
MSVALLVSVVTYAGLALVVVGALSILWPLRFLRIRSRRTGLLALLAGALLVPTGWWWPWPQRHGSGASQLDAFVPDYQFVERHQTRVHAPPEAVYRAIRAVTAEEIRTFRTLTWIRRAGGHNPPGRESILEPDWRTPILDVATRSGFVWLADQPPREALVGTVVCCRGARVEDARAFRELARPGIARAAMNFEVEDAGSGYSRVTTETRVVAHDPATRRRFGLYWAWIYPGSALIRLGWLEAVRRRAEGM